MRNSNENWSLVAIFESLLQLLLICCSTKVLENVKQCFWFFSFPAEFWLKLKFGWNFSGISAVTSIYQKLPQLRRFVWNDGQKPLLLYQKLTLFHRHFNRNLNILLNWWFLPLQLKRAIGNFSVSIEKRVLTRYYDFKI